MFSRHTSAVCGKCTSSASFIASKTCTCRCCKKFPGTQACWKVCRCKKEKKRKTTQAAKHSLHQIRKRRHIGPKCRECPPPKIKIGRLEEIEESSGGNQVDEKKAKPVQGQARERKIACVLGCVPTQKNCFWDTGQVPLL